MRRSTGRKARGGLPAVVTLVLAVTALAGCTGNGSNGGPDVATVEVPAGGGIEYKFRMEEGARLEYQWTASETVKYDFHGERTGAPPDEFTSHKTGRSDSDEGSLTAPFAGTHGWYWENLGFRTVEVVLETTGDYEIVGIKRSGA